MPSQIRLRRSRAPDRRRRRAALALVIAWVVSAVLPFAGLGAEGPELTVVPDRGLPGEELVAEVRGFAPNRDIVLFFDTTRLPETGTTTRRAGHAVRGDVGPEGRSARRGGPCLALVARRRPRHRAGAADADAVRGRARDHAAGD